MTTEIEKARNAIYQRLLAQQSKMSRSVIKMIMEDIDELCWLKTRQALGETDIKPHQPDCAVAINGRHECSCGKETKSP